MATPQLAGSAARVLLLRCERSLQSDPSEALRCASAVAFSPLPLSPPLRCLAHSRAAELILSHSSDLGGATNHLVSALGMCSNGQIPPSLSVPTLIAAAHTLRRLILEGRLTHALSLMQPLREMVEGGRFACARERATALRFYVGVLQLSLLLCTADSSGLEESLWLREPFEWPTGEGEDSVRGTWEDPSLLSLALRTARCAALAFTGQLAIAQKLCDPSLLREASSPASAPLCVELHMLRASLLLQSDQPTEALELLARLTPYPVAALPTSLPLGSDQRKRMGCDPFRAAQGWGLHSVHRSLRHLRLGQVALALDAQAEARAQLKAATSSLGSEDGQQEVEGEVRGWCELFSAMLDQSDLQARTETLRQLRAAASARRAKALLLVLRLFEAETFLELGQYVDARRSIMQDLVQGENKHKSGALLADALLLLGQSYAKQSTLSTDVCALESPDDAAGNKTVKDDEGSDEVCAEDAFFATLGVAANAGDVQASRRALVHLTELYHMIGATDKQKQIEGHLSQMHFASITSMSTVREHKTFAKLFGAT